MKKFTPLAIALVCCVSAASAASNEAFDSYTQAYNSSTESNQPMVVILNPGAGTDECVNLDTLRANAQVAEALNGYIVAEIDVTTPHGQEVHKLFKSPSLPHTVVINDAKKQVYKTKGQLSADQLSTVLNAYRDGGPTTVTAAKPIVGATGTVILGTQPASPSATPAPAYSTPMSIQSYTPSYAPPADCPSCRRNQSYRF